jgi:hypothetical protein
MIRVKFHTEQLRAGIASIHSFIANRAIPVSAQSLKKDIQDRTSLGVGYDGYPFHEYSTAHAAVRKEAGFETAVKNLKMGQGRLYDLDLVDVTLTYTDDDVKAIAHGQQFHPGWSYHHPFLGSNEESNQNMAEAVVSAMRVEIAR